jgi:hypothetical protein
MVVHAIEYGRLLSEAKATVQHGQWDNWIRVNCSFAARTAQLYMRAHKHLGGKIGQVVQFSGSSTCARTSTWPLIRQKRNALRISVCGS